MRPSRRCIILIVALIVVTTVIVALPAVPAEVALLFWGVFGGILLTDLLVAPSRRGMAAEIDLPDSVFTNEAITLRFRLSGKRRLPPHANARLEMPEGFDGDVGFALNNGSGHTQLRGKERGEFALKSVWLNWPSPMRLWEIVPRWPIDAKVRVEPNIRPVSSGSIDSQVNMALFGVKVSANKGEGSEFHQLRDFTTGMDTRMIDWKRSARRRNLVAREMRAEQNHQVILCIDNGHLMREEIDGLPKIDHAINAALATAWAAGIGGDLVGLFAFDNQPRRWVPPIQGRVGFPRLRTEMADLRYASVQSNPTLALTTLNARVSRRSLIIIFSDFVDTTTAELLIENIGVLNKSHLILFVAMSDPEVAELAEREVGSLNDMALAVAASDMRRERQIVLDRLARMGVLTIDTQPGALTAELVSSYINIKAREMI